MSTQDRIIQVAVPAPIRSTFDYLAPPGAGEIMPGARVRVPFGRRVAVGVVIDSVEDSELPRTRLKTIHALLDRQALVTPELLALLRWTAEYYHHPIGEVLSSALPALLRKGRSTDLPGKEAWTLTSKGRAIDPTHLTRAPLQRHLLEALQDAESALDSEGLRGISLGWRKAMKQLKEKGWVKAQIRDCLESAAVEQQPPPELNEAQRKAIKAIVPALDRYGCYLLHGVTGSGKTEVYLQLVQQVVEAGRQALVLVPEIGLTPQLVARFRARFSLPVAVLHSGLTDSDRLCAWMASGEGHALIVLGTRSAILAPFADLGLIIVDEEHDASYKQQEGLRYHARDLAVMRASRAGVAVVLGSATPSLESLHQARQGNYTLIQLPERVTKAALASVELLDMRRLAVQDGLSHPLVQAIRDRLLKKEQSLLFLNRRGYAPVLMCYDCGWVAPCPRCDASLTFHRGITRLRCHHCGVEQEKPAQCPQCQSGHLHSLGEGTERVEESLMRLFPDARIERIDRDTTRRRGALEDKLERIGKGEADILIGTQMLVKGHDFPEITLVGVLNADQGLYSVDFRSSEVLLQQLIQVSGRAGRGTRPGQVLIQTWHPDHSLFEALQHHQYLEFADNELGQRMEAGYPPCKYFVLMRAESTQPGEALRFLEKAEAMTRSWRNDDVNLMLPVPSPMEKRGGRYRAQMIIEAHRRGPLHRLLKKWISQLESLRESRRVRWSLDIDPIDMY